MQCHCVSLIPGSLFLILLLTRQDFNTMDSVSLDHASMEFLYG